MKKRFIRSPKTGAAAPGDAGSPAEAVLQRRGFLRRIAGIVAGGTLVSALQQKAEAGTRQAAGSAPGDRVAGTLGLEPLVGEIQMFAGNFAPTGWAFCNGQLLSIAQNTALFSILGTMYGGNGSTNFALPDLRGRAPLGTDGPYGPDYPLGMSDGEKTHTLTTTEIPSHNHLLNARSDSGTLCSPSQGVPAVDAEGARPYAAAGGSTMAAATLSPAGGSSPHNNMQPYLGVSFIIALQGVFPQRP